MESAKSEAYLICFELSLRKRKEPDEIEPIVSAIQHTHRGAFASRLLSDVASNTASQRFATSAQGNQEQAAFLAVFKWYIIEKQPGFGSRGIRNKQEAS